jgi:hypothetical protein
MLRLRSLPSRFGFIQTIYLQVGRDKIRGRKAAYRIPPQRLLVGSQLFVILAQLPVDDAQVPDRTFVAWASSNTSIRSNHDTEGLQSRRPCHAILSTALGIVWR